MIKGIYNLSGGDRLPDQQANKPFISGNSLRMGWSTLEPDRLSYNFALIDTMPKTKPFMLRVLPGIHSPVWVLNYVPTMSIINSEGAKQTIPILWSDPYITAWINAVNVLGTHYSTCPSLIAVHMAGPTLDSAEFHLPKDVNKQATLAAGYTKDKLVLAWQRVIKAYAQSFPKQMLVLNISIPFVNDGAMEAIIQSGYKILGNRLAIQHNQLRDNDTNLTKIVNQYGAKGVNTGFQMLGTEARVGNMETALNIGLNAGAKYFEIYEADIKKPELEPLFEHTNQILRI